jgi:uncharacterized protein
MRFLRTYIRQHIEAAGGGEVFFSWHGGEPAVAGLEFFRRPLAFRKELPQMAAG